MSAKTNKTVCQKSSNENSCRITFTTINYKERQNWTLLKIEKYRVIIYELYERKKMN